MRCSSCGSVVEILERVGFREVCPVCDAWLHACVNCRFLVAGSCTEPSAEKIRDPEMQNYCEWFKERAEDEEKGEAKGKDRDSAEEMWRKLTKK
jgi:hypothetical protein